MGDRRLIPARPDLAAAHLKGQVEAARFVAGETAAVTVGRARLAGAPSDSAPQDSELLFGEIFTVYERKDGWAWGQAARDGYVGYVKDSALGAPFAAQAQVGVPLAPLFSAPDLKAPLRDLLPLGAMLPPGEAQGDYVAVPPFGFVHRRHLEPPPRDFVAIAQGFLGVPYVWGGKSFAGLDCSGLVQIALQATGRAAPRDTDMQARALGTPLPREAAPARGDLVFWKGHVGVMLDATRLLHANAFHMQVAAEPLSDAVARIATAAGPVTAIRRLAPQ